MQHVDPGFVIGPVPAKPRFNAADKVERVAWCNLHKDHTPDYWYDWVLVDEFTVYEKPNRRTAIHRKGDGYFLEDPRLHPFDYGNYGKLSLCIAVNPFVNLVGYWWIHSTTGYKGKKVYWVSAGAWHPP